MRFVVSGLEHREGFHETGGNLLDIAVDDGPDHLDGMSTWFEQVFPRQAAYDRVGQYISVEADIARHGDLLVMAIDPATMEVT